MKSNKYFSEIFASILWQIFKLTLNQISRVYLIYILDLKDVVNALPELSTASIDVEFVEDPDWTEFKFITKKKGAQGPTKEDCKDYYTDWYVNNYHTPYYFKFDYF